MNQLITIIIMKASELIAIQASFSLENENKRVTLPLKMGAYTERRSKGVVKERSVRLSNDESDR
jgi:hypothetical protein